MKTKFVFITGGVVSSIGKGLAAEDGVTYVKAALRDLERYVGRGAESPDPGLTPRRERNQ